jgi:hypothetical protein
LPYRLIYVGEAANLSERVCRSHEKYESWVRAACGAPLFVAFHSIAGESARRKAEQRLIEHYGPECNKRSGLYSDETNWPFNLWNV